jgi:hypothetical protein
MHHQMTSEKRQWPTLEGRLSQPLTSRVEAVRQLQTMMPITPVAQARVEAEQRRLIQWAEENGKLGPSAAATRVCSGW